MGVGGSFDFLSGAVTRAPRLIRNIGLEWLYRLIVEPWRWRRQLRLIEYIFLILKQKLGLL
jgi:N-acetylglucosaminyldiphosphoundecaprenol N-acetyl-beta-D-mannosaminyltransferase